VMDPVITPIPTLTVDADGVLGEAARDPSLLYVDEVDLEDKMFILQYALGGTRSLERFRREFADGVRPLSSGEDVGNSSESIAWNPQ
jgi:hypothetical protein